MEAHLDGLRIAGDEGWEICNDVLALEDAGEVFAVAELAFEGADEARIGLVLETGAPDLDLSRGLVSALGWLSFEQAAQHLRGLLESHDPNQRRVGIAASAAHRRDPGQVLSGALRSEDLPLKARALRVVGELGRIDLLPQLRDEIMAQDENCRFSAAWSAALFGDMTAVAILKSFAASQRYAEKAVQMAFRRMPISAAHDWRGELADNPDYRRLALIGAGAIGDPSYVPWLIEQMEVPGWARVAGEAFSMITGVDIAYEDLEGEWPQDFEAGPTENPEDESVEMDPDEDLPWPEPERILGWWDQNKGKFESGTRYLLGKTLSEESLEQALRTGYQRQRVAAALELAFLRPGQPLFETRAPGLRQERILGC